MKFTNVFFFGMLKRFQDLRRKERIGEGNRNVGIRLGVSL